MKNILEYIDNYKPTQSNQSNQQKRIELCKSFQDKVGATTFSNVYPRGCDQWIEVNFSSEASVNEIYNKQNKYVDSQNRPSPIFTGTINDFFKTYACDKFPNSQYCTNQQNQGGQTNIVNTDLSCLSNAQATQPGGPYEYTFDGVKYYLEAGKADDGTNTYTHYYYCENGELKIKPICDNPNSKVKKGKSGDPWEYKKVTIKDEKNDEYVQYCTKKQTSDTWIHINMALPKFMDAKVYNAIKDKVNFDSPDTDTSGGSGTSGTSGGGTSGTSGGNVSPELGKTNPIIKMREEVKTQFENKFTCINELKNPYYREIYNSTIQDYEPVIISREGENWLYHYGSGTLIEMTPGGRVVNVGKFEC